jgi:inner membrane protein
MTGRTHDLAAFTAMLCVVAIYPLEKMSLATALVSVSANMIGGLAPDLDQPTAALWRRYRGGEFLGKILHPLFGGHRFISHSLIGFIIFGFVAHVILSAMSAVLIVDMDIVWWAFMIGYGSHLVMDTFTHEGVPWLFPIPLMFGIPPFSFLRMKTGGVVEKSFVFPMLLLTNMYLVYTHYAKLLDLLKHYIVK